MTDSDDDGALQELADAEATSDRLASQLRLPTLLPELVGVALAVQVASVAVAFQASGPWDELLLVAGVLSLPVLGLLQLARFRRLNGTTIDGLAMAAMFGSVGGSTLAYIGALFASMTAADHRTWPLVGLAAAAGGGVQAWQIRRWWHGYQADPRGQVARTPVMSTRVVLVVLVVCLVFLLVTWR